MTRLQGAQGFLEFLPVRPSLLRLDVHPDRSDPGQQPASLAYLLAPAQVGNSFRHVVEPVALVPGRVREVTWIAFLFAIYPSSFSSGSSRFSQHWITYGLFFLSIGSMIQAVRSPRWFCP